MTMLIAGNYVRPLDHQEPEIRDVPGFLDVCWFGDCRWSIQRMIEHGVKVQTVVTSPPYFGLRDYGVEGQMGLESTPEAYVDGLVGVFRRVRDLLADDGTVWLNLGDSYAANRSYQVTPSKWNSLDFGRSNATKVPDGCKPKDLIGIPWRVAFALQNDGWYLRQDIIWHKPNPMPESVRDRCTKAHEYIFLLSKSPKYFFDADAVKEKATSKPNDRPAKPRGSEAYASASGVRGNAQLFTRKTGDERNRRSVWSVATKPYSGAHFAVFPPDLIEPCVLAGSRPGDIVFDPFLGSGTTAVVAKRNNRHWLGCELNPDYADLQQSRLSSMR